MHDTGELFESLGSPSGSEPLAPGAWVLRGFALPAAASLLTALEGIGAAAPFRHLHTPGGFRMSVAMTNCGSLGWVSDRHGYRYQSFDPVSGAPWPPMPEDFMALARAAARAGGFPSFTPDACLINRYEPGARLTLHQDKDERDFSSPIVSMSFGLSATFLFGGIRRSDRQQRIPLRHGDVVVWGGASRLRHHGVLPIKAGRHDLLGPVRVNLTFRRAA